MTTNFKVYFAPQNCPRFPVLQDSLAKANTTHGELPFNSFFPSREEQQREDKWHNIGQPGLGRHLSVCKVPRDLQTNAQVGLEFCYQFPLNLEIINRQL